MAGTIDLLIYFVEEEGLSSTQIEAIEKGTSELNVATYIQNAFDAAAAGLDQNTRPKATVRVPAGRYILKSTVTLPCDVHLLMEGVFVYDDDEDEPILVVGDSSYANQSIQLRLAVERSSSYYSDWSSEDNIGIKLINCYQCDINIVNSDFNTIGLQCIGVGVESTSHGFAYNTIRLGKLMSNKYAVDCTGTSTYITGPVGVLKAGYCNQNTFIGGRLGVSSSYQTGKNRYGVRIYAKDYDSQNPTHSYNTHNNNRFINTSFELSPPGGQLEALPVRSNKAGTTTLRGAGTRLQQWMRLPGLRTSLSTMSLLPVTEHALSMINALHQRMFRKQRRVRQFCLAPALSNNRRRLHTIAGR